MIKRIPIKIISTISSKFSTIKFKILSVISSSNDKNSISVIKRAFAFIENLIHLNTNLSVKNIGIIRKKVNIEKFSYNFDISIKEYKYIKLGKYIKVDKDTLWVTPELWEKLEIMSNTSWVIN